MGLLEQTIDKIEAGSRRIQNCAHDFEKSLFKDIQEQIDNITEKAEKGLKSDISFVDRHFLNFLYLSIAAGGYLKGLPEAGKLLYHYLGESGRELEINSELYKKSAIVKKEMNRQKENIRRAVKSRKTSFKDRSSTLLSDYSRLKYADNRFILESDTQMTANKNCKTVWRVENTYDFEGFKSGKNWKLWSKWSEFPYRGRKLRIYDGLSKYLVDLNLATEFKYYAEWTEVWIIE